MSKFKAVILAGGSGERFWPLSTPNNPKQFLEFFGNGSLIRQCVNRLRTIALPSDIYIVTSASLVERTRKELPEVPAGNIIGEPMRRDTCAAVALGVGLAGDGVIGFFPSDQMVGNIEAFKGVLASAVESAEKSTKIVTIGIKPTHAATGYGYINPATKRFVEKPDSYTAARYLKEGYLWNAGMFIAEANTFRNAISTCAHPMLPLSQGVGISNLDDVYKILPKISFDVAVMEKYQDIDVVPGDFGWDDVGNYAAFDRYYTHDKDGNVSIGQNRTQDAHCNICISPNVPVSLVGVDNLVVTVTPDAILVADKKYVSERRMMRYV